MSIFSRDPGIRFKSTQTLIDQYLATVRRQVEAKLRHELDLVLTDVRSNLSQRARALTDEAVGEMVGAMQAHLVKTETGLEVSITIKADK